ncbi:hypothetical protein JCM11251_005863 [Rhodosporidiobolus azoricus]
MVGPADRERALVLSFPIEQSRHRAVKNLDLADELDDGGFEEDYTADMTSEQQAQMASALSAVQTVLGPSTTISDRAIQDALWDSYFDVDGTVAFLLDEQHKKEERKRKEEDTAGPPSAALASLSLSSPPPPPIPSTADAPAPPTTAPPKNKLAAKMAANKAAKAAAAPSPAPGLPPLALASTAPSQAAQPEKKLSKLQQKMLAAKAGKGAVASAAPESAPAETAALPAPAEEDVSMSPPSPSMPYVPSGPSSSASALFSSPGLVAPPSLFASALSPAQKPFLAPVAARIASSLSVTEAIERGKVGSFGLSPDEKVLEARKGTKARLAKQARKSAASQPSSAKSSRPSTPSGPAPSASKVSLKKGAPPAVGKPASAGPVNALRADMEAMGLDMGGKKEEEKEEPVPAVAMSREKVLKEINEREGKEKPVMSLIVVGHVDAGKSTLMGRLLAELGETSEKEVNNFQRQSEKIGKSSFAYAWTFDALEEERERGVTIDVAIDSFQTQHRRFTLIDAPGHRDFIPNMISGASQADAAILVVDGASGAFEKGFAGGGQTREHALLVRSLGVQQLIVAVNKMDQVEYSRKRFEAIKDELLPFLLGIGFQEKKVEFCPVGAFEGENLVEQKDLRLQGWWEYSTLVEFLDALEVPARALDSPLRIPVQNVFKGQSATASGLAISGRVESGFVQVGEKLAALPGDETGVVRALEVDGELVPYASAGQNATVFLSNIDAVQLNVGSVLCPPTALVSLASSFTAQIIVFEPKHPITAGYAIELFHHSRDIPATIIGLEALLDKATGKVTKGSPRMLTKNSSARVRIQLRPAAGGRSSIPIEPFSVNKSMGRIVLRRNGETVAAGVVLETMQ